MKKIIFALLLVSAIIAAGLTGCSSAADEQSPTVSVTTAPTPSKNPTPASSETPAKTEPTPDEGINWINDWDEALNRAQTENKPMMINFYTDTCPACVKLDNDTFTDEKLANLVNENFINVKSNAGRTPLHANYGLAGVPTTVFATSDGAEMGRIVGFHPPDQFQEGTHQALDYWSDNYKK